MACPGSLMIRGVASFSEWTLISFTAMLERTTSVGVESSVPRNPDGGDILHHELVKALVWRCCVPGLMTSWEWTARRSTGLSNASIRMSTAMDGTEFVAGTHARNSVVVRISQ